MLYSKFSSDSTTDQYSKITTPATPAVASNPAINRGNRPTKLISKEIDMKRAKGECFFCSEKFVPGHKCKKNQLFNIEVEGECELEAVQDQEELEAPHISIHALTGVHSFSTMKVVGSVGSRQLHILIDSGSTHSFINAQTTHKLRCIQTEVKPLSVSVAN